MGHFLFFLAVVVACLLWSAAFTAAAARTRSGWIRRGLIVVAMAAPVLAIAPWVFITAMFAFGLWLETNWFGPTLTTALAVVIGGVWIMRAGLSPRAAPAAGDWPLMRLVAMFVLTTAVAFGTLWLIDTSIQNEMRMVRIEAAQIMQSVATPQPLLDDDAAPLYRQAFELLEADKELDQKNTPLFDATDCDVSTAAVTDVLARHAVTLDLLRRAADRRGCRFIRDWSRPAMALGEFDLPPEFYSMRKALGLLTLAARRTAAAGDVVAALADVVRLHRVAAHAVDDDDPDMQWIGWHANINALKTLPPILARITAVNATAIADPWLADVVHRPQSLLRHMRLQEARGLVTLTKLGEGTMNFHDLPLTARNRALGLDPAALSIGYRCFFVTADIRAFRALLGRWQHVVQLTMTTGVGPSQIDRNVKHMSELPRNRICRDALIEMAWHPITRGHYWEAYHRAAEVLLAATRARLKTGSLPESTDSLVPEFLIALPADPYRDQGPLTVKIDAAGWLVYSVGPDGEDDGGPPQDAEHVDGNDDVGLRLSR